MLWSLGRAKFHMNRCNESPRRGENAGFWSMSKKNDTGSSPLYGNPAFNKSKVADLS